MFSIISPPPARYLKKCKYKMNTGDVEKKTGRGACGVPSKKISVLFNCISFFFLISRSRKMGV